MTGIFVSGGCVTRDTYEGIKEEYVLTGYSARQSLISAASPPTTLTGEMAGDGFELRAVQADLASTLHGRLAEAADATGLFVIDLLVERFGVLELPDATYVTRTPTLNKSGALGDLFLTSRHIRFGTAEHFRLWTLGAMALVDQLNAVGMLRRTLLVETPWTDVTLTGSRVKRYNGWDPDETNVTFGNYFAVLKGLGVRAIRIPEDLAVSDEAHKWGASPFHYAPAAHEWLAEQFRTALA